VAGRFTVQFRFEPVQQLAEGSEPRTEPSSTSVEPNLEPTRTAVRFRGRTGFIEVRTEHREH
ncbi:hypothetical protein BD410DRAFT_794345, partial [Rickenella mellea]